MYYPDGQILEEVYEYGSFTQSKMYHNNVRCSDCHDVHSIKRRKPGNEICLQCHRADTYDTPAHHFHKKEVDGKPSPGALCERCHMPGRFYMVNDWRLDHSLRVPRPDLSRELGTPNACNAAGCHADKGVEWAVQAFTKWYGLTQKPHYGPILAAGRARQPDAGPLARRPGPGPAPADDRAGHGPGPAAVLPGSRRARPSCGKPSGTRSRSSGPSPQAASRACRPTGR